MRQARQLRDYYDALHALEESEQTELAEAHAKNPRPLVRRFRHSLEAFEKQPPIDEPFYGPGRAALPHEPPPISKIKFTIDFAAQLADKRPRVVIGEDVLNFRYVDREIFPMRSTEGTRATRLPRRSLDLLLANGEDRTPILAELKIGGDRLPYFALVQILMLSTEFLAASQRERLIARMPTHELAGPNEAPYTDLYLISFEAPERGRYRSRSLQATKEISDGLMSDPYVSERIRRIAYIKAFDGDDGLEFEKVFAFGRGI